MGGGFLFQTKYACHVYYTSQQPGDLNAKTKLTFDILTKPNLQLPHHYHISNWSHSLKFQPLNSKHNNRNSTMLHSNFVLLNLQINTRNHHPHDRVLGDRTTDRSSEIITWSWRRSVAWLWMYRSYRFVIKDIIGLTSLEYGLMNLMMCMQGGIFSTQVYGASCSSGTLAGTKFVNGCFPILTLGIQCRVCGPISVWQVNWVLDLS